MEVRLWDDFIHQWSTLTREAGRIGLVELVRRYIRGCRLEKGIRWTKCVHNIPPERWCLIYAEFSPLRHYSKITDSTGLAQSIYSWLPFGQKPL